VSSTYAANEPYEALSPHPVGVEVEPAIEYRNRLTTFFRFFLALPHLILVGGPLAWALSWGARSSSERDAGFEWSSSFGIIGFFVFCATIIAWIAIVFSAHHPATLYRFGHWFLRWRVRASAYLMLLRDDYPPFGDGEYPAHLTLVPAEGARRVPSVLFRILLAIPQLLALWVLGVVWGLTTIVAWFGIVFTGTYPPELYRFGVGALRWSTRVEAYLLLLHDEYPPFTIGR
jgi:hypothetical protein